VLGTILIDNTWIYHIQTITHLECIVEGYLGRLFLGSIKLTSCGPLHSHFKAYGIPPIQKWNPNVEIEVKHDFEKPIDPVLAIEFGMS
jgi:hypothetical protein